MTTKKTTRSNFQNCTHCHYRRYRSMYQDGSTICNFCRFGDFRAPAQEYSTPWDMRLASAASRTALTRVGILAALVKAGTLVPADTVRATP